MANLTETVRNGAILELCFIQHKGFNCLLGIDKANARPYPVRFNNAKILIYNLTYDVSNYSAPLSFDFKALIGVEETMLWRTRNHLINKYSKAGFGLTRPFLTQDHSSLNFRAAYYIFQGTPKHITRSRLLTQVSDLPNNLFNNFYKQT